MSRIIMLIPTGTSVGLTSVSLGVIRAMERKGVRLSVFKPIAQPRTGGDAPDQTTTIVRANSSTTTAAEPLKMSYVQKMVLDFLLQEKVLLVQGTAFNWPWPDHFRIVTLPRVDDIELSLSKFARFLSGYHQL